MLTNKKTLLALSIVSALTLTACGSDNDDNVVVQPPVTPPVVTPPPVVVVPEQPAAVEFLVIGTITNSVDESLVEFADAAAGSVKVSFFEGDAPATHILDISGNAVTSVTTTDGTFSVSAAQDLQQVTVRVEATGFLNKSFTIDLSDKTLNAEPTLNLVPAVGAGVVAAEQKTEVTNGTVAQEVVVEAKGAEAEATAEVKIPANTEMQDENGNAVSGTEVTMNVTTATATAEENKASVADLIPAGLNAENATEAKKPLAAANIEMRDNNGNKIKKFSSPITLSLELPAASYKTGQPVSISSYDEDKAVWVRDEFVGTVGALNTAKNVYPVSFQTNHLTLFVSAQNEPVCSNGITITNNGSFTGATNNLRVKIVSGTQTIDEPYKTNFWSAGYARQQGLLAAATGVVTVYDKNTGEVYSQSAGEINVCGTLDVALVAPAQPIVRTDVSYQVNWAYSNCPANTTGATSGFLENAVVFYQRTTGANPKRKNRADSIQGGLYPMSLINGETYKVSVQGTGEFANGTVTFNGGENITSATASPSATITIPCKVTSGS